MSNTSGLRRRRPPANLKQEKDNKKTINKAIQSTAQKQQNNNNTSLTTADLIILTILTLLAVAIRFYKLGTPSAVVFDELHFSKFTDRILTHTWFFDIHPPLGKLILAYVSYAMGYRPEPNFVIEKIGNPYPEHVKYVIVRSVSATFSVATVPITYMISRKLQISSYGSILSASTVLFDMLGIIEGRLILMDSQLLFFCQLALYCALKLWQTKRNSTARFRWLCFTGLASGAALSIKHTALATPGLIAIVSFFGIHFLEEPLDLTECIIAGSLGLSVYAASFYIMFKVLWKTGGKYDKFMPINFRKTLIGAEQYDPRAKRDNFFKLFAYLNKRMVQSNASIKKRHTWESDWYQWIVNWRGVLFFSHKEEIEGRKRRSIIYLLGNPVVIYLALLFVILFVLTLTVTVRYRGYFNSKPKFAPYAFARRTGIFLLSGWLCNLLPYILVDRAAFIYHYLPGLFYAQLLSGIMIDMLPVKARALVMTICVTGMAAAFIYWSPWIYVTPLWIEDQVKRRWLPRWT